MNPCKTPKVTSPIDHQHHFSQRIETERRSKTPLGMIDLLFLTYFIILCRVLGLGSLVCFVVVGQRRCHSSLPLPRCCLHATHSSTSTFLQYPSKRCHAARKRHSDLPSFHLCHVMSCPTRDQAEPFPLPCYPIPIPIPIPIPQGMRAGPRQTFSLARNQPVTVGNNLLHLPLSLSVYSCICKAAERKVRTVPYISSVGIKKSQSHKRG
jgi:hypothetical protein